MYYTFCSSMYPSYIVHAICTAVRLLACVLRRLVTCQELSRTMIVIVDVWKAITSSPFKVECSNYHGLWYFIRIDTHVTSLEMCFGCFFVRTCRRPYAFDWSLGLLKCRLWKRLEPLVSFVEAPSVSLPNHCLNFQWQWAMKDSCAVSDI